MNNITERNAYINWRMDKNDRAINYGAMAEGYHLAAIRLLDSLIEDNSFHDADVVIFPILFSGHQSVELYLKAVGILISEAGGNNPWEAEIKDSHNIQRLLDSLNSKLPNNEKLIKVKATKSLFDFIDLCKQLGDDSAGDYFVDFARYPEQFAKKSKTRASYPFVLEEGKFVFDLTNTKLIIDETCELLGGLYAQWLDRAQLMHDAQS